MARTKKNSDYDDFLNRVNGNTTSWSNKYQNGNSKSTSSNNSIFNNSTSSSKSNKAYDVDFDTFYNRVQGSAKSWYEEYEVPRQQKELEEEIQKEVAKDAEQRARYFEVNKEALKEERKNSLIYNWSVDKSGGIDFDYNYMPVRDENGYAKKTDSKGNVYWVDLENDLLYDKNHKLINDNRLRDKNFIDSLKYEYDENTGKVVNAELLKNSDRIGLVKFDKSQYNFLVTNENDENKKKAKEWNNKYQFINQQAKDMYLESRKGLKTTPYGEGLQNAVNEKNIKTITEQNPYENKPSIYEEQFEKFNEAIEKGQFVKANNALQEINEKYFGHSYVDGWWDALFGNKDDDFAFFNNRFNKNVEKLNTINSSIKNTRDEETLKALYEEKNKLELENQLIQYNKLTYIQSDKELVRKMDAIMNPVDEAWSKVGDLWGETFSEFDDGYDFGDLFKTAKKTLNNAFQTIGALGKQTNAGIQGMEYMLISDMDEGEFKDTWAPAIMDVATYVIPYVGQARIIINYAEPGSVVGAGILREGSATIDSADGKARVPDAKNVFGASINIAANFASDYIFSKIRSQLNPETINNWYKSSAKTMITEILKEGVGEGAEEFIQTYAEYMQNMDGDMSFEFFKEHWSEAWKSAFIAFVTASGASFTTSSIGKIRSTVSGKQLEINEALKSYDAVDNIRVPKNIEAGEDIKVNEELSNNTNRSPYISNTTDTYEDMSYESDYDNDIIIEDDEDAVVNIAERLQNDEVITILNDSVLETDRDSNPEIDIQSNNNSNITVSDRVLYDNSKITIVPSKEMETYLKNLDNYNGNPIYVADPKSPTFMDDVRNYVNDIGKSNIVVKNNQDFNPNEYVLTPQEMNDINNMVTEYTNKANLLDNINNPSEFKLTPITVSDISDSDINTIVNTIKNKFLDELSKNRYSKETAIKEFKTLSGKLEGYLNNREQHRTYLSDNKNRIVTFYKTGPNLYEAANTLPKTMGDLYTLANVKTNGNVLNGNITSPIGLTKQQANNVNNLISKLGLKGNFLTEKSSGRDVAELVKLNRGESKEILQALGADGLIEGKNKVRLYTAYDNLDNANVAQSVKNNIAYFTSKQNTNLLERKSNTEAPLVIKAEVKPDNVKPKLKTKAELDELSFDSENTSELNNVDLEEEINNLFKNIEFKDKTRTVDFNNLKLELRKAFFDRYAHIKNIAISNQDVGVSKALVDLNGVSSDATEMIQSAQVMNGEVVGKSLNQIYKDNNIKSKKDMEQFDRAMLLMLNAERERAGIEKVFSDLSAKKSEQMAKQIFDKHPNFVEASKDLQRYNNNLLDMLVNGEVIEESLANTLKDRYKYYMPIYSSELSTFNDLGSDKYIKNLSLDDTIKDATKTAKQIQSLRKSLENKTYNVVNAIAKNKLAQEMAKSGKYNGDEKSDLIYYENGKITKMKTSNDIISDLSKGSLQHKLDNLVELPGIKQIVGLNKLSIKFILDPIYQVKNLVYDFTDSAAIYSKDRKHFIPNYARSAYALANNSEFYQECLQRGVANYAGTKVEYDSDGNIKNVSQNKFQRIYNNLENIPKMAEFMSLKAKYLQDAKTDIEKQNAIDKAVVDAKEINLNFDYGGTIPKMLSKTGFKFINAGFLGLDKFVSHVGNNIKTPKGVGTLALEFIGVGASTALANYILNGEDEDYDKLPYYYKNNYFMFKISDGNYLRLPKGRIQALYNTLFEYATGIREEDDIETYIESTKSAFELAILPPGFVESSPLAALTQIVENKDSFGNEIYSEKYDSTEDKYKKLAYHFLGSYFGRYGRILKDLTDNDSTTDWFNELDYYKNTAKANRHYGTVLKLVDYYGNKNNIQTIDDKAMKKYIDTQNYALREINSEINQGKKSGRTTDDMMELYAARNKLLEDIINNYKKFDKFTDSNGNTVYNFDDHEFTYNESKGSFKKNY